MKLLQAQPWIENLATERSTRCDATNTYLYGRTFAIACALWIVLVAFALLIYVINLPVYFARLATLCLDGKCVVGQLTVQHVHILQSFGLSLTTYAASIVFFNIAAALVWFAVGSVLFWRKTRDRMALLVSLTLMVVGAAVPVDQSTQSWQWATRSVDFLAIVLLFLVFCLFPNGRFEPRWMRWLPPAYILLNLFDMFPILPGELISDLSPMYFLLMFGCIGAVGVSQIYRYRHLSRQVERQQVKWVVFSTILIIFGEFVCWLFTLIFPSLGQFVSLYDLFFSPVTNLLILLIPLSLGMAILRYRLWDIDVLLHRTLIYGTLTAILTLMYFCSVALLQRFFYALTGQDSSLAVVISTLLIALPFRPLLARIQLVIDRHFYRRKYDAAQTLAAFAYRLRQNDEVDLSTLTKDILEVVAETMQPTHVSMWMPTVEHKPDSSRYTRHLRM